MSDTEKEKAWKLARLIRRDKNLAKLLSENRRNKKRNYDDLLETLDK